MKSFVSKWWPSVAHVAGITILFLNSSVQSYIGAHAGQAAFAGVVWGILLHWAQSPKAYTQGSKF